MKEYWEFAFGKKSCLCINNSFRKTMAAVILNPDIPYVGPFGGGSFSPKKLVKLEGTIPPYAYGFDINLQCGPNTFPHDDIALQISVRFLNGYISLNSSQRGIWEKEIQLLNIPIEDNQKFKITVLSEFKQYKVDINDKHFCIFPHRISWEKVNHLSINGDVSIIRISYESIYDSIPSDSTTTVPLPVNEFNDIQHSDSPLSNDTAINRSKDVESQNGVYQNGIIKVGSFEWCYIMYCLSVRSIMIAWYSHYNTSSKTLIKLIRESTMILQKVKKMDEDNKYFSDLIHLTSNLKHEIN